MIPNHYRILQVEATATPEELKDAYRQRARETHPDNPSGREGAFLAVKLAYDTLSDAEARAEYEEEYVSEAVATGKVVCASCFQKNRVGRFPEGKTVCCGFCKEPLSVTRKERDSRVRAAVAAQTGELIEVIGVEGSALAKDAVRSFVDWSRRKLGIARR